MDIDVEDSTCASFKQKCHVQDSPTHKDMYKRTPKSWKDKFRRACVQRLRKNRTKLVEQLRGAETLGSPSREEKSKKFIDELMREELDELKNIQDRPNTLCTCCTRGFHDNNDDGSESMFDVMDEIREELMKEEKLILEEYDDLVNFDENYIHAAIESLGCDHVICPVCKRNQLLQNKQIFFCSCGLRIDTGYDGITLAYFKNQIEDTIQQHGSVCNAEPLFSVLRMDELELHNLTLSCKECDFMAIVI